MRNSKTIRQIKFRGKSVANHIFFYGDFIQRPRNLRPQIKLFGYDPEAVFSETVTEFTGLTDKFKTAIYEGDIIKLSTGDYVVVEFKNGGFGFQSTLDKNHFTGFAGHTYFDYLMETIVVVGNIFDNPELIK